ncbi:MAG: SUMF1/EgtB/PvdO family nonheme iron enzyme [Nitrospinae bacterium]|nr:SUMF1/EgtB/PvdO family nonheme iron enzyme [Nitrospinota bacterium]
MVLIPEGEFVLGLKPDQQVIQFMSDATLALNAQPAQRIQVKAFFMDRYEVTYEKFRRFKPKLEYKVNDPQEPIRGVNWYEADAYCLAQGKRLPAEIEWEKAARGTDERLFVWGSEFNKENANFSKHVRPVGKTPMDTSHYGLRDMNGNVAEWTANWYQPYPNSTYKDKLFGEKVKVLRGGSIHKRKHGFMKEFTMVPYRNFAPPGERFWDTGFRCAKSA